MAQLEPPARRAEVLDLLRGAQAPMSIAEIAEQLDVHANTVRFHLNTLVANKQAERVEAPPTAPGRPPQLFRAVSGMDPAGPRHYRILAEALTAGLASDPDPTGRAVAAGQAWGRHHAAATSPAEPPSAVRRLTGLLDELGFAPEAATAGGEAQIRLHHCPFLELARDNSQVICSVHLGLMRGALESWNSPVSVERLDAFAQPNLCLAHLTSAAS